MIINDLLGNKLPMAELWQILKRCRIICWITMPLRPTNVIKNVPKSSKMSLKISEIHNPDFTLPEDWKWVRLWEALKGLLKNINYRKLAFGL